MWWVPAYVPGAAGFLTLSHHPIHSDLGLASMIFKEHLNIYDFGLIPALENVGLADYPKLGKGFSPNAYMHRAVVSDWGLQRCSILLFVETWREADRGEKCLKGEVGGGHCGPDALMPEQTTYLPSRTLMDEDVQG